MFPGKLQFWFPGERTQPVPLHSLPITRRSVDEFQGVCEHPDIRAKLDRYKVVFS